jgi:hypothetical protein
MPIEIRQLEYLWLELALGKLLFNIEQLSQTQLSKVTYKKMHNVFQNYAN